MDKEVRAIKEELFRICWFMRGGLTVESAYETDLLDREVLGKIIESNLDTTKKSGLPFF